MLRPLLAGGIAMLVSGCVATQYRSSPPQCLYKHEMAHDGGWPANHPGAVYPRECEGLLMPPRAYPVRVNPMIKYVPRKQMIWHCGPQAQACSSIGGNPSIIYLPSD